MPKPTHVGSNEENSQIVLHSFTTREEFNVFYKKFYHGKADAKKCYLKILAALEGAVSANDIGRFKYFSSLIGYINNLEDEAQLRNYYADAGNSLRNSNLIILACKHNKVDIIEEILSNDGILNNLGQNNVTPEDEDETCHNAFYYAMCSGNSKLLDLLIKKWPGGQLTNVDKLEKVLSSMYKELNLKNIELTNEIKICVENELLNIRFYSNGVNQIENVTIKRNNIKQRIKLVLENVALLKTEYSTGEVDENFLFISKFIVQNIFVLKRHLKYTYDKLPWEEIEFCLIAFISSYERQHEINLFFRVTLNKSKIINYLRYFAEKLVDLEDDFIANSNNVPNLNRDQVVTSIVDNCPQFEQLYSDFQKIRDVYSLQQISNYVNLTISVNAEEKEGQLVVIRTLQVMGEHLKNTLQSPKLSSATINLLLLSLPEYIRKIVIGLRNSLSHGHSLLQRSTIEENSSTNFFKGIQKGIIEIGDIIRSVLYEIKIKTVAKLLKSVVDSQHLDDIKDAVEVTRMIKVPRFFVSEKGCVKFETLIAALNNTVTEKTSEEENLFKEINNLITSAKSETENVNFVYTYALALLRGFGNSLKNNLIDPNVIKEQQFFANEILRKIFLNVTSSNAEKIVNLVDKIFTSFLKRMKGNVKEIERIVYEIFYFACFKTKDIRWFEKMQEKLRKTPAFTSTYDQKSSTTVNKIHKDQYMLKLSQLKTILHNNGLNEEYKFSINNHCEKLQAALEMLIMDIMSILESEDRLENNLLFLNDDAPLLTGKSLRNHLAHDNVLVGILCDPSIAIILNARKLLKENLIENKKKIGKLQQDNPAELRAEYLRELEIVTNQKTMYAALEEGNMEVFNTCLKRGADVNCKNVNSWTTLHFASKGPSLEMVKYLHSLCLPTCLKDIDGRTPLHIAAAFGRNKIVEFFIKKLNFDVNDYDYKKQSPLHIAALNGRIETVRVLLENNANAIIRDSSGQLPLHFAINNNHIDVVKCLLTVDTDIDKETSGGHTLLHGAAERGHVEMVELLLQKKANVNAKTETNWMPLHGAALNGHVKVVKSLIENGADVNAKVITGGTALHYAVEGGHKAVVDVLLKHGSYVNIACKMYKCKPLHIASKDGHQEIVEALLAHSADASARHGNGMTPLHFAADNGHLRTVIALLKQNVDVNGKDILHSTPLHYAARNGHRDICEILLKNEADKNALDLKKSTPLHEAATNGHKETVRMLISKFAIYARDGNGETPLHLAAKNDKKDVIEILLKNNAKLDSETYKGFTPLHLAASHGSKEALLLLIENKAEINTKGLTPLHLAAQEGCMGIVKILIENNAKVNAANTEGKTVLHIAATSGHRTIVELLIINGASIDIKDSNNWTPLCSAITSDCKEIVKVLIRNGADVNAEDGKPLLLAAFGGYSDIVEILLKNNAVDSNGSALQLASSRGHTRIVKALLSKQTDAGVTNDLSLTPLHLAARNGDEDIIQLLIAKGANVNDICKDGSTALHLAAADGHEEIVRILLNNGADVTIRDGKNRIAVELAVAHKRLGIVKMLLQNNKSDINVKCNGDWTLLHIATQSGDLEIVKCLITKGSDINAKNASGSKSVHIAAREGHKNLVEYFLDNGFCLDDLGAANQTILHYATLKGQLEIVKLLIARGADINVKDANGMTSLHIAASAGCKGVISALLESGAIYNCVDRFYRKPIELTKNKDIVNLFASTSKLFEAVKQDKSSDVQRCINQGAFIDAKNSDNITPLHHAAWKGYRNVVNVLLQNKAKPNVLGKGGASPLHYAAKFSHLGIVQDLLKNGASYDVANNSGKTPMNFSEHPNVIHLLKMVNDSFRHVQSGNSKVINILNKIKDVDVIKAIMNARNKENKSLIVVAINYDFSKIEQLKQVLQEDASGKIKEGEFCFDQGLYQKALCIFNGLLEKRKEILGPDNPGTLDIQTFVANALYKNGANMEALKMQEEIYQKQKEMFGVDYKDTLSTRDSVALILHRLGKNEDAFNIYEEIYQKQKEILGPNHLDTLGTKLHMALVLERLGRYEEALNFNKEIFKQHKKTLGPSNPATLSAQNNIAMVLSSQGKYEEALKVYNEVFERKKAVFGLYHGYTLRTLQSIASIFFTQQKFNKALASFQEVLDIQEKVLDRYHPEVFHTQYKIAETFLAQYKPMSALQAYQKCLEQRKSVFGESDPFVLVISKKMDLIYKVNPEVLTDKDVRLRLQKDIHIAASDGDLQTVRQLLKDGANGNDKDMDGITSLHYAVNNGHIDVVKILLKNGVDVCQVTNKGNTALHTAAIKGYNEIAEILLQHVGHESLNFINTATNKSYNETVEILVQQINSKSLFNFINVKTGTAGTTSLHVAAQNGFLGIVKILLRYGAIYDIKNKEGKTPLDISRNQTVVAILKLTWDLFKDAKLGNADVITKLRAIGYDDFLAVTNARNYLENTLLQTAIINKHKEVAKKLSLVLKERQEAY